jgi:uncharacterized membrane protein YdjX (TVP38/TMEM64 family)
MLLRLSPIIPFGINNYMCGCSEIEVWKWVVGTFFGVLPGTTAYCNLGAMGKKVRSDDGPQSPLQRAVMVLGIVAALAVVKIISDIAKNALVKEGIGGEEAAADEEGVQGKVK